MNKDHLIKVLFAPRLATMGPGSTNSLFENWGMTAGEAPKTEDHGMVRNTAMPRGLIPYSAAQEVMNMFPKSDIDNADRFVKEHGQNVRYCPEWRKWVTWNGSRWVVGNEAEVNRRAEETVKGLLAEAKQIPRRRNDRKDAIRHALMSQSDSRIKAMLNRAKYKVEVNPDKFDRDDWLFNSPGRVVNLRTGQIEEQNREDYITKITPIPYIPEWGRLNLAKLRPTLVYRCPQWFKFLDRVLGGEKELAHYLQKAVGYSLTGDTREQCFFLLYGEGSNGKSTFLETLRRLLGDYARQTGFSTFLVDRNDKTWHDLARLKGARLVTAIESDPSKRFNETVIKQITGEDTITARFLYQEHFEYRPQFKLWLATNEKPEIRGSDFAIWRRVHLIPFTIKITEKERDPELKERLYSELPEIFVWAVEGCLLWQEEGLRPPDVVSAAIEEYKKEMDIVGEFLDECCEQGPGLTERANKLHSAFTAYCERNGIRDRKLNSRKFAETLRKKGFDRGRDNKGNYWKGLEVRKTEFV